MPLSAIILPLTSQAFTMLHALPAKEALVKDSCGICHMLCTLERLCFRSSAGTSRAAPKMQCRLSTDNLRNALHFALDVWQTACSRTEHLTLGVSWMLTIQVRGTA